MFQGLHDIACEAGNGRKASDSSSTIILSVGKNKEKLVKLDYGKFNMTNNKPAEAQSSLTIFSYKSFTLKKLT